MALFVRVVEVKVSEGENRDLSKTNEKRWERRWYA